MRGRIFKDFLILSLIIAGSNTFLLLFNPFFKIKIGKGIFIIYFFSSVPLQ